MTTTLRWRWRCEGCQDSGAALDHDSAVAAGRYHGRRNIAICGTGYSTALVVLERRTWRGKWTERGAVIALAPACDGPSADLAVVA